MKISDILELPDIHIGDEIKIGKFKNRKAVVKGFDKDKNNQPILKTNKGDVKLFKPRIVKLEEKELFDIHNPRGINPALMTFSEYRKMVDPDEKWHPNSAYNVDLKKLSGYGGTKEDYPILLRRIKLNGMYFEFRLQKEKRKYCKTDNEGEYIRDENNQLINLTDEEIKAAGKRQFENTIGVFDEDGKRCASAQDEFGCMLIMVAKEYRGFGLGPILGKLARTLEPEKSSGGFTQGGYNNFVKVYREFVRDALKSGLYRDLMSKNEITADRVKQILKSADLSITPKTGNLNLSTNDPKDWVILAQYGGFAIYDTKLKDIYKDYLDQFGERFIKGNILTRINKTRIGEVGILVQFGGDSDNIKSFLIKCAASYCAAEGAPLAVDEQDMKYVDQNDFEIGATNVDTGLKRTIVKIKEPMNVNMLSVKDRKFRKEFDQYDEFKNTILELAEAKYR